jgi:hypothetical protein
MDFRWTTSPTSKSVEANLGVDTPTESLVGLGIHPHSAGDTFPAIPEENFTDSVKRQVLLSCRKSERVYIYYSSSDYAIHAIDKWMVEIMEEVAAAFKDGCRSSEH